MGFRDWLKAKKKKRQQERMEKRLAEEQAERSFVLSGNDSGFAVDPADIDPPETRFTDEYREFLDRQEAEAQKADRLAQARLNEEFESDAAAMAESVQNACADGAADGDCTAEDN